MRRNHVATKLIRRHVYAMCPLGSHKSVVKVNDCDMATFDRQKKIEIHTKRGSNIIWVI